ncbi:terminase small subunit [Bacillus sp. B15-48]|uniref:terminase small subunit n=1 Tax=Bacillus sp. B15-48 TaxID=1548601 RepID=UPI00193EEE17|nr:terminase small subunit [Bacillus sp. B15-48]MBM4762718.1 terminase small subunit [Bacillus sp. B15-48]
MPNWDEIRREYESSKITLVALAEKYGVKIGTLKSRKSREGWSRGSPKKDATKRKKVATVEPVIENDSLNDKQKLFCLYYLKYFNATKAYMKAYGGDRSTAESIAYRVMANDGVKEEIERLKQERFSGILLDAQAVLQKYIDIAFADITDFVEFGREEVTDDLGNPFEINVVKFKDAAEVDGTLITEVKKGKDGVSVKLADKMKALEFLSKYTNLLSENDRKKLQDEKLKAETEFTQQRSKQIKGTQKDTSMLDALVEGRKQYEQMIKEREKNE